MKVLSRLLVFFFLFLAPFCQGETFPLLIVEVQINGEGINDDFIKIYNPNSIDIDLSNYKLKKKSSAGKEYSIIVIGKSQANFQNTIIPAKGYFVWANSKNDFHLKIKSDTHSAVALSKNNSVALISPENKIIDSLTWGKSQNPFVEGIPFPENPGQNEQLKRKTINNNYQDTNQNSQDFFLSQSLEQSEGGKERMVQQSSSPEKEKVEISLINDFNKKENNLKEDDSLSSVNINSASEEELQKLTGVGSTIAKRIIEARPFYSLDELEKVSGIGQKTLEEIKEQGLAWVDPELKKPEGSLKENSLENEIKETTGKELAAISQSVKKNNFDKNLNSSSVFLIASLTALFSGGIVLILKKKLNKNG